MVLWTLLSWAPFDVTLASPVRCHCSSGDWRGRWIKWLSLTRLLETSVFFVVIFKMFVSFEYSDLETELDDPIWPCFLELGGFTFFSMSLYVISFFFECIWHWNPLLKIWFMSLLCDSVAGAQVLVSFKATLEAKKLNGHLVQDRTCWMNERRSGNWQMMTWMKWPENFQSIMILFGISDCWCPWWPSKHHGESVSLRRG